MYGKAYQQAKKVVACRQSIESEAVPFMVYIEGITNVRERSG